MTELEKKLIELGYSEWEEVLEHPTYHKKGKYNREIIIMLNKRKNTIFLINNVRCKANKKILKNDLKELEKVL